MEKVDQPPFRISRLFADIDDDNPEREPLISPSSSFESKKGFDTWGQPPVTPTYYFYDSEISDVETASGATINNNTSIGYNKSNKITKHHADRNSHYNYNIRRPHFHREASNNIFNCSKNFTQYNTIASTPESNLYIPLSPAADSTTRLYCPAASMTAEEETKLKTGSLTRRSNSCGEKGYRSNENNSAERKKQSSLVTVFSIWNTMVGTSLLAIPWGMERSGLVTGFIIAIIMGAICLYTAYCNIDAQRQHGSPDGEIFQLCEQLLGRWAEVIAKIFSYLVLLGAVIIYWILMSNFLNFSVDYFYTLIFNRDSAEYPGFLDVTVLCPNPKELHVTNTTSTTLNLAVSSTLLNRTTEALTESSLVSTIGGHTNSFGSYWNLKTVPIFLALIIGPLLCFRSPTFFTKFTSLGTLSVMFIVLFVLIKSANWGFVNVTFSDKNNIHYTRLFNEAFGAMCGMLSLSYFIHNIVISIVKNNKHQENNTRDLSIAYILVMLTYILIGVALYVSFPIEKQCIEDNLLNNFKVSDPLTVVARLFLFFQLVTVYPLLAFLLRSQILTQLTGSLNPSYATLLAFNVVLILTCVLFAIFLPHIGTVTRFTGAISGFVHVFTLPCLLRIASLRKQGKLKLFSLMINSLIPVLGAINIMLQFFVKEN